MGHVASIDGCPLAPDNLIPIHTTGRAGGKVWQRAGGGWGERHKQFWFVQRLPFRKVKKVYRHTRMFPCRKKTVIDAKEIPVATRDAKRKLIPAVLSSWVVFIFLFPWLSLLFHVAA